MKKKLIIIGVVLVASLALGRGLFGMLTQAGDATYEYVTITRGDVESTISASGTISPVTTIDVSTQVSGTVAEVFVDYNDEVHKGQIIAVLDTVLLKASVLDAEAGVQMAEAQLSQAEAEHLCYEKLFERQLISQEEYLPVKVNVQVQQAALKSALASLQRAEQNLAYAVIMSPIDGTVISKSVESGQTVAASLSAPILFQIAENLSHLEILVEVDESDIGLIKVDQAVRFDVQAYADEEFTGTVTQLRLQPTTINNVVTYTVVVAAENRNFLLLPGMTATVDFITEAKENVLLAPKSAVKLQPTVEMIEQVRDRREHEFAEQSDSTKAQIAEERAARPPAGNEMSEGPPADLGLLWFVDANGQLQNEPVQLGMSDTKHYEIIRSRTLTEGMEVIGGLTGAEDTETADRNTFNMSSGRRPGGGSRF